LKEDVVETLMIFYNRIYHEEDFREGNDWRAGFMWYVHIVPLALLLVDMFLNRIKIRFMFIVYQFLFTGIYIVITVVYQMISKYGVYFDNLDWFCSQNNYYVYDYLVSKVIDNKIYDGVCQVSTNSQTEQGEVINLKCNQLSNFYCADKTSIKDAEYLQS